MPLNIDLEKTNTANDIVDELHSDVGAGPFELDHSYFFTTPFSIWTGAGATGTQLIETTDFMFSDLNSDLTTRADEAVYRTITIVNVTYQSGDLYFTYHVCADIVDAEDFYRIIKRGNDFIDEGIIIRNDYVGAGVTEGIRIIDDTFDLFSPASQGITIETKNTSGGGGPGSIYLTSVNGIQMTDNSQSPPSNLFLAGGEVQITARNGVRTIGSGSGSGSTPAGSLISSKIKIIPPLFIPALLNRINWATQKLFSLTEFTAGNPHLAAFDGQRIWIINDNTTREVARVDIDSGSQDPIITLTSMTAGTPTAIAFDGQRMWITNGDSTTKQVVRVNVNDGTQAAVNITQSTFSPNGIAFDGTYMWIGSTTSSAELVKINVDTDAETSVDLSSVFTVIGTRQRIAMVGTTYMWVTNYNGTANLARVAILPGTAFAVSTSNMTSGSPYDLAFDGFYVWITNNHTTRQVLKINGSGVQQPIINLTAMTAGTPRDIVFDGRYMWISNGDATTRQIVKVDIKDNSQTLISLPSMTAGSPSGLVFDGIHMWLLNNNSTRQAIKITT